MAIVQEVPSLMSVNAADQNMAEKGRDDLWGPSSRRGFCSPRFQ